MLDRETAITQLDRDAVQILAAEAALAAYLRTLATGLAARLVN
jgi:hypothetical protein